MKLEANGESTIFNSKGNEDHFFFNEKVGEALEEMPAKRQRCFQPTDSVS